SPSRSGASVVSQNRQECSTTCIREFEGRFSSFGKVRFWHEPLPKDCTRADGVTDLGDSFRVPSRGTSSSALGRHGTARWPCAWCLLPRRYIFLERTKCVAFSVLTCRVHA